MKFPIPDRSSEGDVLQIQCPICDANFSNNIGVTQVRINERETEPYSTFKTS